MEDIHFSRQENHQRAKSLYSPRKAMERSRSIQTSLLHRLSSRAKRDPSELHRCRRVHRENPDKRYLEFQSGQDEELEQTGI